MSKVYALTGGVTGIGAAVKKLLVARGDRAIVIDLKNADINEDLSTQDGCHNATHALYELVPNGLDGFIPCAGLGPHVTPPGLIAQVNFFAVVRMIEGVKQLLLKKHGSIVVISSNSASLPGYNADFIQALSKQDEEQAISLLKSLDGQVAYGGSKYALTVWMRKNAPGFMRDGIRMNAVAPGVTDTAMTDRVFKDEQWGEAIKQFNKMTPYGKMATPEMIARCIIFLLDPAAEFVCGSVLFVDGGTDALLRPERF